MTLVNGATNEEMLSTRKPRLLRPFFTPEPEVNRRALRDALLEGVDVQWGGIVESVDCSCLIITSNLVFLTCAVL